MLSLTPKYYSIYFRDDDATHRPPYAKPLFKPFFDACDFSPQEYSHTHLNMARSHIDYVKPIFGTIFFSQTLTHAHTQSLINNASKEDKKNI